MTRKGWKNQEEQAEELGRTFKNRRHKHSAVESDINRLDVTAWTGVWTRGCMHLKGIVHWVW